MLRTTEGLKVVLRFPMDLGADKEADRRKPFMIGEFLVKRPFRWTSIFEPEDTREDDMLRQTLDAVSDNGMKAPAYMFCGARRWSR